MRKILVMPMVRFMCWYLVLLMSGAALLPTTVHAAFISPSGDFFRGVDAKDLATVKAALENDLLRERLEELGLSPEEINSRLESLSPEDHQAVLADVERIQAGGDAVGTLLSLAILVLLIILILKLMDKEITIK